MKPALPVTKKIILPSEADPPSVAKRAGRRFQHSGPYPPRAKAGVVRHRILIIVNPAAGRARSAERRLQRFVIALERQGCGVVLRRALSLPGDAERLAREAEADFDAIVAAGGDGTVHAVVNGLAGSPTPIGVLPF